MWNRIQPGKINKAIILSHSFHIREKGRNFKNEQIKAFSSTALTYIK